MEYLAFVVILVVAFVACVWFGLVRPRLIDSGFWLTDHRIQRSKL